MYTSSSTSLATRVLNAARPSESEEFLEPRTPGSLLIGQPARASLLIGREIWAGWALELLGRLPGIADDET